MITPSGNIFVKMWHLLSEAKKDLFLANGNQRGI